MKQLITILFITIYLLSLAGNSIYVEYLIDRSAYAQNEAIDNGLIDKSSLLEMKIPFRAPYYSSSATYERFYGEINVEGIYYTYVERKVINDTIYLLCLPDHEKTKLQKAKSVLAASEAGIQNKSGENNPGPSHKKVPADYDEYFYLCSIAKPLNRKQSFVLSYKTKIPEGAYRDMIKPPGYISFT